ncbi:MAG TPA: PIN domain-containing protein [Solirubrobacteraceae bacterium]|nr:PIN domain-containing protein [Solirubrobacteraceae bacterium]
MLVDSGPLVAAANRRDTHHEVSAKLLREAAGPLLVSAVVIAEVGYFLEEHVGGVAEAAFLRSFGTGFLTLAETTLAELDRAAELVEQYADLPLGTTDAVVVATAERLGATTIATLDRRHFSVVRPRHVEAFTLLP